MVYNCEFNKYNQHNQPNKHNKPKFNWDALWIEITRSDKERCGTCFGKITGTGLFCSEPCKKFYLRTISCTGSKASGCTGSKASGCTGSKAKEHQILKN
jgi:hypothetical protein